MKYKVVLGEGTDTRKPVQMYCLESEALETDLEVIMAESIPEPVQEAQKMAIPYYNSVEGAVFYEYVDKQLTPEEQLQQDLGNVLFESAMDKARIAELEINQGEMLMEIAMLKGGSL